MDVSSEDVGKHLAEHAGCGRGGSDPGWRRPCGTNLLAAPELRLPTPRACVAATQGLWPLTLNPSDTRLKRARTRAGGMGRGRCLADASAVGVGAGNGNIPLEGAQPPNPQAPKALLRLWRWPSGLSSSLVEQVWSGEGRSGQESWGGLTGSRPPRTFCTEGWGGSVWELSGED